MQRIKLDQNDPDEYSLVKRWSNLLYIKLGSNKKSVLEIRHSGGWYLAEFMREGSQTCSGLKVSESLNLLVNLGRQELNYKNLSLETTKGNKFDNEFFDYIHYITSFQNIPQKLRKYIPG